MVNRRTPGVGPAKMRRWRCSHVDASGFACQYWIPSKDRPDAHDEHPRNVMVEIESANPKAPSA